MNDYERLRELAENATPGPWACGNGIVYDIPNFDLHRFDVIPTTIAAAKESEADAQFIAAANPDAILALLAELYLYKTQMREARAIAWDMGYEAGREYENHNEQYANGFEFEPVVEPANPYEDEA